MMKEKVLPNIMLYKECKTQSSMHKSTISALKTRWSDAVYVLSLTQHQLYRQLNWNIVWHDYFSSTTHPQPKLNGNLQDFQMNIYWKKQNNPNNNKNGNNTNNNNTTNNNNNGKNPKIITYS